MAGTFAQRFLDWCTMTISIEPYTGPNAYGESQYGPPVFDVPCRIDERIRMVRDSQGVERASTTVLFVIGGPLDARDRITMPGVYKGIPQPPIITVSNFYDKDGFDHSEVYL